MELIDYFLGEPEYDENGNVVKRNFQIQNLLFVIFTGYLLYSLWCKTKKQVGGTNENLVHSELSAQLTGQAESLRPVTFTQDLIDDPPVAAMFGICAGLALFSLAFSVFSSTKNVALAIILTLFGVVGWGVGLEAIRKRKAEFVSSAPEVIL